MALLLRFANSDPARPPQQHVPTRQCRNCDQRHFRNHQSVLTRQEINCLNTAPRNHHEQHGLPKSGWSRTFSNWYFDSFASCWDLNRSFSKDPKSPRFLYENQEHNLLEFPDPILPGLLHRIQLRSPHSRPTVRWRVFRHGILGGHSHTTVRHSDLHRAVHVEKRSRWA